MSVIAGAASSIFGFIALMITNPKMFGLLAIAFVAGTFFASPIPQAIAAVIAKKIARSLHYLVSQAIRGRSK